MFGDSRLLVVDDEEMICQGCRRVFARQGFQVDTSSDAHEGLNLATEKDYSAIVLDIKMPSMDGIQFLEELRKRNRGTPVILMTGYPSMPSAASAIRFGASDYVTKPFTPEELTQAVQRLLRTDRQGGNGHGFHIPAGSVEDSGPDTAQADAWTPAAEGYRFWDESWLQPGRDGSVRVGSVLSRVEGIEIDSVTLPRIGEVVYQGLPLAGVVMADRPGVVLPSPISGVVVAVNEALATDPAAMLDEPCGRGWIAAICPTRLEAESDHCRTRRVVLANANPTTAAEQSRRLASLGCRVRTVANRQELLPVLQGPDHRVLIVDAGSFGQQGPELVQTVNATTAGAKTIVVASPDSRWEAAYREQRVFYYAISPFADGEIVEILDAVFNAPKTPAVSASAGQKYGDAFAVNSIRITNRNGRRVRLLAERGLLRRGVGLGANIRQKLLDRLLPVDTIPGDASLKPLDLLEAASTCDHLVILVAREMGRLPGSLVRDTQAEYVAVPASGAGYISTLIIQPDPAGGGIAGLAPRTLAALAEHVVQEMLSCE